MGNLKTENMTDSTSFFGDPKVIISLLALIIASISLIWTFANQWEQNRKWDNLNEGNPEIREIRLLNWKELSKEEAINTLWGYDPTIYGKEEASDRFVLPYYLTIRDGATNLLVPNTNPVFTFPEIEYELKRVDFKGKVVVNRLFKPKFEIENMGKTEIKELLINVDAKLPDQEWNRAFSSNAKINLAGSQKSTVAFSFEIPVGMSLPDQISFKVHFSYMNYKGKSIEKIIGAKWTTIDNFWSYETINE